MMPNEADPASADGGPAAAPVVAVVGRPNVGKSTLVNRILGSRQAVVEDTPGVTRDRVAYDALWSGREFTLVDTGGWEPAIEGSESLAARVAAQARVAVDAADAVLFVVDATVGVTDADEAVANVLRRSGKPVVVAANKVDDTKAESEVAALWSLGLGEPAPVSALHGRGSGDLLDLVLAALPDAPKNADEAEGGPRRVALIGRPNVGKSSLLNKLAGHSGPSSTRSRAPPGIRWTSLSSSAARPGGSWTRPASGAGSARTRARTTTRPCAPRARWTRPRSPSCWWMRASR